MSAFQPSSDTVHLASIEPTRGCEPNRTATMTLTTRPKKKRHNHNELERKRRHHQREVLYELRDVIPTLHIVKPSTVLIMQKAKEYIDLLRRTIQEMDIEINDLRRALVAAGYPLPMPAQQQLPCGFPAVQPTFTSSSDSPCILSEQVFNVASQSNMPIDQNSQISFSALGELAFGRGQFDAQDIDSINHLQSVLSKSTAEIATSGNRPISPVSPYQLEQAQGHTSGEFKALNTSTSVTLTSVPHQTMLGSHV